MSTRPPAPIWQPLVAEAHAWAAPLRDPIAWALLLALALFLVLRAALPLHIAVDVGIHEGYGGDLPHLAGFNTPEHSEHGSYRWTKDGATARVPGVGRRPLLVRLSFLPVDAAFADVAPRSLEVWAGGERVAVVPVRPAGAHTTLLVPPRLLHAGTLALTIHTDTFTPPDDPRQLGTPLDSLRVESADTFSLAAPDWGAVGMWLCAVVLLRALAGRCLSATSHGRRWANRALDVAALLVALAAWFDPPRWSFGAWPALETLLTCAVLALLLRALVPRLAARLAIPLNPAAVGVLILLLVLAFGMRYGGRIYPQSMPGDITFHTHRFIGAIRDGTIFLRARNRGVDFPYPPGPYLTLAPAALLLPHPPTLLERGMTLVDSVGVALVYTLVAVSLAPAHRPSGEHNRLRGGHDARAPRIPPAFKDTIPACESRPPAPRIPSYQRTALLAGALYTFTPAAFWLTWWSFDTHIATQCAALLLVTALVLVARGGRSRGALLFLLLSGIVLGHFGFFINTTLLMGLVIGVAWWARRRGAALWRPLPLALATGAAIVVALLTFYSAYLPLFAAHLGAAAEGGLSAVARREPVTRGVLWHTLWHDGLIGHVGFFPLLLLPVGVWYLARRRGRLSPLLLLMGGSLLVSAFFAALPFLTLSTQNTRWLMFSAWAIAVGAALAVPLLWRAGRAGRVVVLAMGGGIGWLVLLHWLGPMLWRIRPPEPF